MKLFYVLMLEAKICSQTENSDFKGLSMVATVPDQQTGHAGAGIVFDTQSYCSTWGLENHSSI